MMYEDQPLPSVAFVTPLCLIGVTALILVVRIGGKLAVARSLDWGDGEMISLAYPMKGLVSV